MQPALTLVSNRLPVSVQKVGGKLEFYPSAGGLATGMASYTTNRRTKWIGWPGIPTDDLTKEDRQRIIEELAKHNCYPVFLNRKQIDNYYNGYSNSILWPLFHGTKVADANLEQQSRYWETYQEVNRAFARTVLKLSPPDALIWVHDYQLLLLPLLLKTERPDGKIGFFLHIPFPPTASFVKLHHAEQLTAGMLGADLVGFHTRFYMHYFLETASELQTGIVTQNEVVLGKRVIRIAVFPISIDYAKYASAIKLNAVKRELAKLRLKYYGRKVILTVDRLDPAKGLVERAEAYQSLLRSSPELQRKVVMIMLVVPSRTEIAEYQLLKTRLEALVADINKEFGAPGWRPIDYMYRSMPFERLSALYRRADIAFIAPLRDGMNLVAKEYVASQVRKGGVLVLSHTAGVAQELKEAIIVNPSQLSSLVQGLRQAVEISKKSDWNLRVVKMQRRIRASTIHTWAGTFINTLHKSLNLPATRTLNAKNTSQIATAFRTAKHRLFLLDYDGTLTSFKGRPEDVKPSKQVLNTLTKLANTPHTEVVIVSGRPRAYLEQHLGQLPLSLTAEHGAFYRTAHEEQWHHASSVKQAWKKEVIPLLEKYAAKTPGAFIEAKESAAVWHYRLATPYYAQKSLIGLRRLLVPLLEKHNLRAHNGKKILEIRTAGIDKGSSAKRWLINSPDFVLAAGDDYTDEDSFLAVPDHAFTIKVGRGRTTARLRTPDINTLLQLLAQLSK